MKVDNQPVSAFAIYKQNLHGVAKTSFKKKDLKSKSKQKNKSIGKKSKKGKLKLGSILEEKKKLKNRNSFELRKTNQNNSSISEQNEKARRNSSPNLDGKKQSEQNRKLKKKVHKFQKEIITLELNKIERTLELKKKSKLNNGTTPEKKKNKKKKRSLESFKESPIIDQDDEPPMLIEINPIGDNFEETDKQTKKQKLKKVRKEFEVKDSPEKAKKSKKLTSNDNNVKSIKTPEILMNVSENPFDDALKMFEWVISPTPVEDFFRDYWESKTLHISRNKPRYYVNIFDSAALDRIFRENSLFYTRNVDVVSYENGEKQLFNQEGRAVPTVLWDYYSNGCSIRLLNPQTYNKRVHVLVTTLQEYFGSMVGVNVYLTPPGSQGFAPHYDDIEAFVVQLEGRKYWKLYHPKENEVLARDSSPNFNRDSIGEPFKEVILEAGDLLYFPRGVIHEGRTDEDNHSLHMTISVYQHNAYVDLLEHALPAALTKAASNDIEFRKGLPLHYLKHIGVVNSGKNSTERSEVANKVKELVDKLKDYLDVDSSADHLGRRLMYDSMPPAVTVSEADRSVRHDGDYLLNGKVYNRVEIDLDTMVRLVRYYSIRVAVEDGVPKLYYCTENGMVYHEETEQSLDLDPAHIPAIKMLQRKYPNYIQVEQLPLDDVAKVQFVSDLWEHGILITREPLNNADECGEEDYGSVVDSDGSQE